MYSPRQQQIINNTMEIIGTEGMNAFTISNLARKTGISESAIYRHFNSKDEIITEMLNTVFLIVAQLIGGSMNQNENSASIRLQKIVELLLQNFKDHPSHVTLLFAEEYFMTSEKLKLLVFNILNSIQLNIQQVLDYGKSKNEFPKSMNTASVALIFIGAIRILLMNWKLSNYQIDLLARGRQFSTTLIKLITKV